MRKRWGYGLLILAMAFVTSGCLVVRVDKNLVNSVSSGPFTVHVECVGTAPAPNLDAMGLGALSPFLLLPPADFSVTPGVPVIKAVRLDAGGSCTFTEPTSAASRVSIVCNSPGEDVTCIAAPGSLIVTSAQGGFSIVGITITDDYTLPSTPSTSSPGGGG